MTGTIGRLAGLALAALLAAGCGGGPGPVPGTTANDAQENARTPATGSPTSPEARGLGAEGSGGTGSGGDSTGG
jgi:hypothetical protein